MIHLSPPVVVVLFAFLTAAALAALRLPMGARAVAVIDAIAAKPLLAAAICAAVPFAGSALVAWLVMWPQPVVHDEFSYLLAADTFAHGRLKNPTHPLWPFFESFHIFHQPTYGSKYPPAQGLLLALGQLLGSPVVGVWLGAAAMGACLYWMLRACVGPRWAFLGALAAAAQIGITKYWTQSFWGGALATAGGALLLGAVLRLERAPRTRDSLALGFGLLLLANARPFEGLLLAIVALAYLAFSMWRRRTNVLATAGAAALVLGAGMLALAWDNHVVTGKWWDFPYIAHERIYATKPLLVFQKPWGSPDYRHYEICRFYGGRNCPDIRAAIQKTWDGNAGASPATADSTRASAAAKPPPTESDATVNAHDVTSGAIAAESAPPPSAPKPKTSVLGVPARNRGALDWFNLNELRQFFLGRVLLLPFALGLLSLARPPVRLGVLCLGAVLLALKLSTYFQLHYMAPFAGAIFVLVAVGMEQIARQTWRGLPLGCAVCAALLVGVGASTMLYAGNIVDVRTSFGHDDFIYRRAEVLEKLEATPGRDLVVVRYGPRHIVHHEWVYNAADIDGSEIVWARDMGAEKNRELLDYFKDRRAWLLKKGFSREEDGLGPYPE